MSAKRRRSKQPPRPPSGRGPRTPDRVGRTDAIVPLRSARPTEPAADVVDEVDEAEPTASTNREGAGADAEPDLREMVGGLAGVRRWFDRVPSHLRPGEQARCAATAFLKGQTGVVLATTERLLFVRGDQIPFSAAYPAIHEFHARMGVLVCELHVEDESGPFVFKQIHPKSRLRELAALLAAPPNSELPPAAARPHSSGMRIIPTPASRAASIEPDEEATEVAAAPPLETPVVERDVVERDVTEVHSAETLFAEAWSSDAASADATPDEDSGAPVPEPAELIPAPAWLRDGERVIAEYGAVELLPTPAGEDAEPRPGTVSVTDVRVVFCAGADIREWPFQLLDPASEPGAGIRTALTPDSSVIFDNPDDARAFEATLREAAGLADQ